MLCYETVLIRKIVFMCACGHVDMRTGHHKVLAATLTLFQTGVDRLCPPPSFIPTIWNIGILHHKQAKLYKDMQQSADSTKVCP